MRIFLLIGLLFASGLGYGQEKGCSFSFESLILPDSLTTLQFHDTIKAIQLKTYHRKGKIPRFIKKALNCWTDKFDIANVGRAFYATDAVGMWPLPHRQLMYLGLNDHYLLMAYQHGGRAFNCPILFIKFDRLLSSRRICAGGWLLKIFRKKARFFLRE